MLSKTNDFISFFQSFMETRTSKGLSCFNYDIALKHLIAFSGGKIAFNILQKRWLIDFQAYLAHSRGLRSEKPLSKNSANTYFRIVISIAREAANERLIDHKEVSEVTLTAREKSEVACLSLDELQRLAKTPCRVPILKKAFLFSCLTGLQWKEIDKLQWNQLKQADGLWSIQINRNNSDESIPLTKQARELLGSHGQLNEKIFNLHYSAALCVNLNQWALKAGVLRNITFQSARQTFGKLLLDSEVPIELISELLGHRHVKTTQKLYGLPTSSASQSYLRTFNI
jgi:integrase